MSMMDVKATMHRRIEELFGAIAGNSSDEECEAAVCLHLKSYFSDLASLSFYLGCDPKVFQDEAVPASELAGEAYFDLNREREFEAPAWKPAYSTLNHQTLGLRVSGADLR